jgi:two-component system, sensor histidine kinase
MCYTIEAQVRDNGVGFAPDSASFTRGFGLAGMQERARKIGAHLQIESASGQGTRVSVQAPYTLPGGPTDAESERP